MKATSVTKCKGLYSFKLEKKYQEKNLEAEYLLSCGKNNAFNMKTVFMQTVYIDRELRSSQSNQ